MEKITDFSQPPPSFQPQIPRPAATTTSPSPAQVKPVNPDLITRYNLATKVSATELADAAVSTGSKSPGWSANKNERAEALRRRREEMVLAARRKMEERDRQKATSA